MGTATVKLNQLIAFKERDKFSIKAWNERGLNPSGNELCEQLTLFFNACADRLIYAINNQASDWQQKRILTSALSSLRKSHYDTEERGFICDLIFELATIVEVDVKYYLNKWMYGSILATLVKISSIIRPERIVETIENPCSKCNTLLKTHILKREEGIPASSWLIVKCLVCEELNLLSPGPNIKELRFGNYRCVETLSQEDYNYEQAKTRLEQIQFFRK